MISSASNQHASSARPPIPSPGGFIHRLPAYVLLVLLLALAGCSADSQESGRKSGSARKTAVAVTTALSATKDVPITIEATGRIEASATVGIRSKINGTLETIHFTEGQEVRKGDLLFTIDRRPYLVAVKAKEAMLAKNRAELANAEKELQRYLPAARKGYVSQEQADQAATKVASLAATVRADESALDTARLELQFCSLTAPFDGRAGEIQADEGSLIKANDDNPLVTINRIAPITVAFDIPGRELPAVQRYLAEGPLTVQVRLPGNKGGTAEGALSFVDNKIDPATGTVLVKADFANTGRDLWPGQLIPVSLRLTTSRDTLVVPSQAVQTGQDGRHVYVVRKDSTVEYRPVTVGAKSDGETVIEAGLKAGERVVTDGHLQLVDGGSVEDRSGKAAGGPVKEKEGKRGTP